jgi:flagellar biosynthetic protein FliP
LRLLARLLPALIVLLALGAAPASARGGSSSSPEPVAQVQGPVVPQAALPLPDPVTDGAEEKGGLRLSSAVEIGLILTILTVIPALVISLTSFTRIVIVLSFVRRSPAVQELPPDPVLIGLALFLTTFVMGPVFTEVYDEAYLPYREGELAFEQAGETAWGTMRGFLLQNTRQTEIDLFVELADLELPEEVVGAPGAVAGEFPADALPFRVVVPAFVLSELKTAFQMGFLLFLPFLVIDLVIASVLISMGMFMLPPAMISTPFKILLFVLVDGWRLVCESLVTSFVV